MRIQVLTPAGVAADEQVSHLRFDAVDGSFTFLPNHADFVSILVPGLVSYVPEEGKEEVYMACDGGILVKANQKVMISVRHAVVGQNLRELARTVDVEFKRAEENRKAINAAMARLEVGLTRGVLNIKKRLNETRG